MEKKALIAMSGGVDSSVAAFLMKQDGWDCIGATMKLFDDGGISGGKSCCSLDDVNDARDVAYRLNIPYYVLNFRNEFRRDVIERFISAYEAGGTPNPCIDCNRFVKFDGLLRRARALGYGRLVTGHYARIERLDGRFLLTKADDEKKDQSYVLYAMTQEQLENTVFPLGAMRKDEVRRIASEQGFINSKKRDSQDICFAPDGDYGAFMERHTGRTYSPGDIIDVSGTVLGRHNGFVRYTIGQRRGLGVALGRALYVTAKSKERNTVTLGPETALYSKSLTITDINLIACENLAKPLRLRVKTRYLQTEQDAVAEQTADDTILIEFDEPQRAITEGQAAVMYDGRYVIGGGTITNRLKQA
jgi:tRNA-specific 2-thiouridylase